MDEMRRVRLEIYGKVQGVFYRATTREKARELGVAGWVRNRADGSVEAVVEGQADAVGALVEWAHDGSPSAQVDNVDVHEGEYTGQFESFQVRR